MAPAHRRQRLARRLAARLAAAIGFALISASTAVPVPGLGVEVAVTAGTLIGGVVGLTGFRHEVQARIADVCTPWKRLFNRGLAAAIARGCAVAVVLAFALTALLNSISLALDLSQGDCRLAATATSTSDEACARWSQP